MTHKKKYDLLFELSHHLESFHTVQKSLQKTNYIIYCSNHLPQVKAGDIRILHNTSTIICQGNEYLT